VTSSSESPVKCRVSACATSRPMSSRRSRPEQRLDVLLENPPWVAYRHLSPEMKPRLRDAYQRMNLWVGGVLATQQDLAALFWARAAERYLRPGGASAFVLPYAALNRPAFAGLRRGDYQTASVRIIEAWSLELVRPLFPTSACVLSCRYPSSTAARGCTRRSRGSPWKQCKRRSRWSCRMGIVAGNDALCATRWRASAFPREWIFLSRGCWTPPCSSRCGLGS
jgi:hypothetical protein